MKILKLNYNFLFIYYQKKEYKHNFLYHTLNTNNYSFNFKLFFLYLIKVKAPVVVFIVCYLWGLIKGLIIRYFIYLHTIFHHNYI